MMKHRAELTDEVLDDIILQVNMIQKQITEGVKEIHGLDFIHRDLKPENIVEDAILSKEKRYKICDFGISIANRTAATRLIGTPFYMAPELLEGKEKYDQSVDIWSLGCIIFELLSSDTYLHGDSGETIKNNLRSLKTHRSDIRG